jgi:hypothetical protein
VKDGENAVCGYVDIDTKKLFVISVLSYIPTDLLFGGSFLYTSSFELLQDSSV